MRGAYERVSEYPPEGIPYIRNLALATLGRTGEALQELDRVEYGSQHRLVLFVTALRETIQGDRDHALEALRPLCDMRDPEARYYVARHLAYLGEHEEALSLLARIVEEGFFCVPAMTRDPWLDSVRAAPVFTAILQRAESRHRKAVISFLQSEGDRILGVSHPA
jgi:tetratricopeptide (TPR) repeat protein